MRLGLLSALVAIAGAGQAQAATTIGSELAATPQGTLNCGEGCMFVQRAIPGRQVTAPIDGVVVRWRMRIKASLTAPVRLRLVRGAGAESTAVASSEPAAVPTVAGVYTFDTRLPIKTGDFIGLSGFRNGGLGVSAATEQAHTSGWQPALENGETRVPEYTDDGGVLELLINADIEPDADADGFGDESQDRCAALPNADQTDTDLDGQGNVCDSDDDNDGVVDSGDSCPLGSGPGADSDGDGCKDQSEDADDDNDGIADTSDACPTVPTTTTDGCPAVILPPADTVAPSTTITSGPPAKTRSRRAAFGFASDEVGSTFQCKLTGAKVKPTALKQYSACTSVMMYKRLKPGKYRFFVFATDPAGNSDLTPGARRFRIVRRT